MDMIARGRGIEFQEFLLRNIVIIDSAETKEVDKAIPEVQCLKCLSWFRWKRIWAEILSTKWTFSKFFHSIYLKILFDTL